MINGIEEARELLRPYDAFKDEHKPPFWSVASELFEAKGYIRCYETDPHVRALIEAAEHALEFLQYHNYSIQAKPLGEALRPFEKEEKTNG